MTVVTPGFDERAWSGLRGVSPLHRPEWLRVMGGRVPGAGYTVVDGDRVGFYGAVVSAPDAYEAYNPHVLLWRDPPVFPVADPAGRAEALAAQGGTPDGTLPALVLVTPGYLGDPAGRDAGCADAVRHCLDGAAEWGRENGMAALYVLYARSLAVGAAVADLGGVTFPLTERCVMPVWWRDWESYLAGFSSSRRRELRRERRRAEEAGVRTVRVDPRSEFEAILRARCSLLERYGQQADTVAERLRLERMIEVFGSELTVYGARYGEELVACSLAVRSGRSMHVVYTGSSDRCEDLPFAHFLGVFYAVVDHTDRTVLDEIDYGIGHSTGKILRGCSAGPVRGHAIPLMPEHAEPLRSAAALLSAPTP